MRVNFSGTTATVEEENGTCVLVADLDKSNGLFVVRSAEPASYRSNTTLSRHMSVLFPKNTKQLDRVKFFSATMGSPASSTLLHAVVKGWVKFPELTASMVRDHPHSVATDKGHLNKTRSGLDSTTNRTTNGQLLVVTMAARNTIFTDLTGRFPHVSARGMEYMMCTRCSESNFIHVEPMKNRSAKEITVTFERAIAFFREHGMNHAAVRMDNETSNLFRDALRRLNMTVEFIPPDNHRQNPAERDIQTFKNHFIATLSSLPPDFPINEWDLLLPQAEMTLNLMRGSNTAGSSAFQHLYGPYDFERNPIAPPGTPVLIYESPEHRASWAPHGVKGFYIGPAMEHYRSFRVLVADTRRIRTSDSVAWHPTAMTNEAFRCLLPETSTQDEPVSNEINSMAVPPVPEPSTSIISNGEVPPDPEPRSSTITMVRQFATQDTQATTQESMPQNSLPLMAQDSQATTQESMPQNSLPLMAQDSQATTQESMTQASLPITQDSPTYQRSHIRGKGPSRDRAEVDQVKRSTPTRKGERKRKQKRHFGMTARGFCGMAHSYRSACKGPERERWLKAGAEEFQRLLTETSTMRFIKWQDRPADRKVSYYNPQVKVKVKLDGSTEYRVRGTYGGNITDYEGPTSAQTADMVSIKILLNSVVSDRASFMTMDIKDFYLGTPMDKKEYMRVHLSQIPQETRDLYLNDGLVQNECVLAEVNKGIYGLTQAGILAQEQLFGLLSQNGFHPISPEAPCVFKHETRDIIFSLVVDDFGVKYKRKEDVRHLAEVLKSKYIVKEDWTGRSYVGFQIDRDEGDGTITISMPGYIDDAIKRFNISTSERVTNPAAAEDLSDPDLSTPATDAQRKRVQEIIGVLLYYARAIDSSILTRVSKVSTQQSKATVATLRAAERILAYAATQKPATITFHGSKMVLICYSDASYLNETEGRSRAGGLFYLGSESDTSVINGAVLCKSSIVDVVVSSAAESEFAAAFMNAKEAAYLRNILTAMGYPQPATPILTDNAFVSSIVQGTCKAKRSKAMDMRFYWLRDRAKRSQFDVRWCKGTRNISDHLTKDLPTAGLQPLRRLLLSKGSSRRIEDLAVKGKEEIGSHCEKRGVCHSRTEKPAQDPSNSSQSTVVINPLTS
jgi:hypothetical protein